MSGDLSKVVGYFNIALVVIFILLIVGVFLAAIRGLRRGVWKSTHNMVFMLSLIVIAFVTLDPVCKFVENFNITKFYQGTVVLSQVQEGTEVIYYVPISTVKETVVEFLRGIYLLFNVSASTSGATNFAFAIAESLIKILLFIIEMLLIVTIGNLFSLITWYAIFQHFVPNIARRVVKVRWLGALETATTFLVLTVLFFTPFTAIVNSINQSYQRNRPKSDNEIIMNIGNFVDAYNDSLFAKILFNWTVDENGMTIDTKLFSTFTTGISEDVTVNIMSELGNLADIAVIVSNALTSDDEGNVSFDAINLIYKDTVNSVFDVLGKSDLISNIFPIAAEVALHSDMLNGVFPARLLNISDVEWKNEIGYVQEMVECLFDSGVIDALIKTDETGKRTFRTFQGDDLYHFFDEVLYAENFDEILNVFKSIDDSKIMSRLVPALVYMFENSANGATMQQYLPFSWDELNELSWGYETYVLFDFLHKTISLDRDFLKAFLIQTGALKVAEGEEYTKLSTVISRNVDGFNDLIVGKFDNNGKLLNVDKYGRTIVFQNGKRLEGRNYCLFDMKIIELALPQVLEKLFDLDIMKNYKDQVTEDDNVSYVNAVKELKVGKVLENFKAEFGEILDVVGTFGKDEALMESLLAGKLDSIMPDTSNPFSIPIRHIRTFQEALGEMDDSKLLYAGIIPVLKTFIGPSSDLHYQLTDYGIDTDVIISAINQDTKKTEHEFFDELSSFLDCWQDLSDVFTAMKDSGDDIMSAFKGSTLTDSLVNILNNIISNKIINPDPAPGDWFEKNENLYGLLEYVFGQTGATGFNVTRETLRNVEKPGHTWSDEITALGNIISYIANHDVMNASKMFDDGLTKSALNDLNDEEKIGLPKMFELIDDSYIFSSTLGPFLDNMFSDSLSGFLTDSAINVSFSNVTSWANEGQSISNIITSLSNLVPANDEEAKDFLSSFELSKLHNVVELNDMLHQLANSGIFLYIDTNGVTHYQFGAWFYQKINDAMDKFTVNTSTYDLLADPKPGEDATWTWKDSWGVVPGEGVTNADPYFQEYKTKFNADGTETDTHMLAYRDFVYFEGIENTNAALRAKWCNYEEFTVRQNAFLAAHKADLTNLEGPYLSEATNYWGDYYASDAFMADYNSVFECDEISKVCRFLSYSMRVCEPTVKGPYITNADKKVPFNELPTSLINNLLTAINNTSCLRTCIYNFYQVAADNLLNGYGDFNLSSAYNIYMIDANCEINDFTNARGKRQAELDKLIDFYEVINDAKAKGIIADNKFVYSKLNQDGFISEMKRGVKDLNDSFVFHRLGSAKVDSSTTFQGLFNSMLTESSIKDTIYLSTSPKDQHATNYDSQTTKVKYLVNTVFPEDSSVIGDLDAGRNKQHTEIDYLLDCVDAFYSLKDSAGNQVTDLNAVDMNKSENIDVIETLFTKMNDSDLLYDCLPNSIYKIFLENNQFVINSGSETVDFKRADPYYHYYFYNKTPLSAVNYNAKYLSSDINGIVDLLTHYQQFNNERNGQDMANPQVLQALTAPSGALTAILEDMHNANIFHSPARFYRYAGSGTSLTYYTNTFNDGFTLFEEMMNKICTSVKLDTFAYDALYDVDFASSTLKLKNRIFALTKADDGMTQAADAYKPCYHATANTAWDDEINSIMQLANVASGISSNGGATSLDVSSFEFDKLSPEQIRDMLTSVNNADLVADAVPGFIEKGFNNVGLTEMSTYHHGQPDAVNYNVYRIDQRTYGDYEINSIYEVMESISERNPDDSFKGYIENLANLDMKNLGEKPLKGLVKFIYRSHILNTGENNVYNAYYLNGTHKVTAQGVLIYNTLGNDLRGYISKDAQHTARTDLDRIASLSKLVHLQTTDTLGNPLAYDAIGYAPESEALVKMVAQTTQTGKEIDSTSFSSGNIKAVQDRKDVILAIVEAAYDPDGEGNRSYIVSEFVSGIFNTIFESEYSKITTKGYAYNSAYYFGQIDAEQITKNSYNDINEVEYNGLNGILSTLDIFDEVNLGHTTMKNAASDLSSNFALMRTDDENSMIARVIYLAEAHQTLKAMPGFTAVQDNTCASTGDNVYSNTFSFAEYGQRLETYLNNL